MRSFSQNICHIEKTLLSFYIRDEYYILNQSRHVCLSVSSAVEYVR